MSGLDVSQQIITSLIGGGIAYFLTEFIFRPFFAARRLRAEIYHALLFYADVPGLTPIKDRNSTDEEKWKHYKNANDTFRRLGSEMQTFTIINPFISCFYRKILHIDLNRAGQRSIGLSNSVHELGETRHKQIMRLTSALKLPHEDF